MCSGQKRKSHLDKRLDRVEDNLVQMTEVLRKTADNLEAAQKAKDERPKLAP